MMMMMMMMMMMVKHVADGGALGALPLP